jgi:uncharacterized paraquat-inducible protein A
MDGWRVRGLEEQNAPMFLIDSISAANGERLVRKRRACRKCHKVNVVFAGNQQRCEKCRLHSRNATDIERCIAMMRLERAADNRLAG